MFSLRKSLVSAIAVVSLVSCGDDSAGPVITTSGGIESNLTGSTIGGSSQTPNTGLSEDISISTLGITEVSSGSISEDLEGLPYEVNMSDGSVAIYRVDEDNNINVSIDVPNDPDYDITIVDGELSTVDVGGNLVEFEYNEGEPEAFRLTDLDGNTFPSLEQSTNSYYTSAKVGSGFPPVRLSKTWRERCAADKHALDDLRKYCSSELNLLSGIAAAGACTRLGHPQAISACLASLTATEFICVGAEITEGLPPWLRRIPRCIADDDNDGVANEDDLCPTDSTNSCDEGDSEGEDTDRDGVPDEHDNCPAHHPVRVYVSGLGAEIDTAVDPSLTTLSENIIDERGETSITANIDLNSGSITYNTLSIANQPLPYHTTGNGMSARANVYVLSGFAWSATFNGNVKVEVDGGENVFAFGGGWNRNATYRMWYDSSSLTPTELIHVGAAREEFSENTDILSYSGSGVTGEANSGCRYFLVARLIERHSHYADEREGYSLIETQNEINVTVSKITE